MSWVEDEVDEVEDEESTDDSEVEAESQDDNSSTEQSSFERQLQTMVDTGSVGISERILEDSLEDVTNEELLLDFLDALTEEGKDEKADMVGARLKELGETDPTTDEEDTSDDEEDTEATEDDTDNSSFNEDSGSAFAEETDTDDTEDSVEETTEDPDPEPEPEPVSTGGLLDSVDLSTSTGMSVQDAAKLDKRWTVLVWGEPGLGKSHFAFTAPEPVMFIDTENKANHLADKFDDREIMMWQPENYDEAKDALHEAMDILHEVRDETGQIGTIVVDSMSKMWGWSQQKHADKFYGGQDVSEVKDEFQSAMGQGPSDWQRIKRYHNAQFRQPMVQSPFHLVWTAMRDRDYNAAIQEDVNFTPKKPAGEKDNEYEVTEVIRLSENDSGTPVGELEKSDKTKYHYEDLEFPTFPKHREAITSLGKYEAGDKSRADVISGHGIGITEGNPRRLRRQQDE